MKYRENGSEENQFPGEPRQWPSRFEEVSSSKGGTPRIGLAIAGRINQSLNEQRRNNRAHSSLGKRTRLKSTQRDNFEPKNKLVKKSNKPTFTRRAQLPAV